MDTLGRRVPLDPLRRLDVDKDVPLTVANGNEFERGRSYSELSVFFRRLDVAESVEGGHMTPGRSSNWLPDDGVDVVSDGDVRVKVVGSR